MEHLLEVNGTRLFVDERGPRDGAPLLFVHGGPGQSCWDYMAAVGDELAARGVRIIGVDQRGILRSDPLPHDEPPLTVEVLIEDFEAVRSALGITRWTILGHSAGGGYALDYCLAHPDSVQAAIFDCPSWDQDLTDRYRLPVAADMLERAGKTEPAVACRAAAASPERLSFSMERLDVMQQLEGDYLRLFVHDAAAVVAYEALLKQAPTGLDWSRGLSHLPLAEDMYRDRVAMLPELACPSLLIHGESDLVVPPQVINAYRAEVRGPHHVVTIKGAGHFSFVEQPVAYLDAIVDFIRAQRS